MTDPTNLASRRFTVHFKGHVQGVGFRYTACRVADGFDVHGYARNLPDGTVELVAEGHPAELRNFLGALTAEMGAHIREHTIAESPASGEFNGFGVAY